MNIVKVIVGGISLIIILGVFLGIIAGICHKSIYDDKDAKDVLSPQSKSIAAICIQTDFQQRCVDSIASVAIKNGSSSLKDFVDAAFEHTINQVQSAINTTQTLERDHIATNATQKMAVNDCKDLLQYAVDELQSSFLAFNTDFQLHTLTHKLDDLKNWLSAVISYQQTCLDGLSINPALKNLMLDNLVNATELTSNALAIISAISDIFDTLHISLDTIANATTLSPTSMPTNSSSNTNTTTTTLPHDDDDIDGGYPTWMSSGDKKLLGSQNNSALLKPNAVVAQDGSGQFKTISQALAVYPKRLTGRYVIYVKAGIYYQSVIIKKDQVDVFIYGDGPDKTIITGNRSFKDGITTYKTATFSTIGSGFIAKSMGFRNTAGPKGQQAVALHVQSDKASFYDCRMEGYQGTLYQQAHRQFYRSCVISGTIDFIFGDAAAIVQNSLIIVRRPDRGQKNTITSHGRANKHETTGLVIQNCSIVAEQTLNATKSRIQSYLGRPSNKYARTIIMESTIKSFIHPAGWLEQEGNLFIDTVYYAEYGNQGEGGNTNQRVKWKGFHDLKNKDEVLQFTG